MQPHSITFNVLVKYASIHLMKKRDAIIYWISTPWLALGMVSTGVGQIVKIQQGAGSVSVLTQLGYPLYFLTILGVWKILGTIAILLPKFPLLKEWAYAGFFFAMTGAIASHIASGSSVVEMLPALLLLILTIVSWYFRPADKKVESIRV
jgi:uncharacterized membrane protein YphA (DoxX/SURF4 family)